MVHGYAAGEFSNDKCYDKMEVKRAGSGLELELNWTTPTLARL